ncbi:ankycorbin isoform X2 [Brienomyrus brachyistius]|uniref:ankycorbin isoform X2 n=1 Tax=Brienomyrus brachyistius TaxID=42636 RepID=UPI0020B19816|nr:ankycorbin isoform X2 [Brienomyrus brachyistius]
MKSLKAKFRKSDTHEWSKNDDRLLVAVEQGEAEKVTSLLAKKGASAAKLGGDGKSALHVAAAKGQAECLAAILVHGVDTSVTDASGFSALQLAAKHSHPECVRKLLQSKCAVDVVDGSGRTALHHAAISGSAPIIQLLCDCRCPINVLDAEGRTALHLSACHAHAEACHSLLEAGADVNARDRSGCTAVMLASESSSLATVEVLVQHGADLKLVDSLGHSVLHYASSLDLQTLLTSALQADKSDTDSQPGRAVQHDQVTRVSEDRSSTPKKRKAPPPPLMSPVQSADVASPPYLTPTQTPPSGKSDTSQRFSYKAVELINADLKEEVERLREEKLVLLETIEDLRQMAVQTHVGSEEQAQLTTLQAQVAALSLENQQLANTLKAEKTMEDSRPNSIDSNASYHSTRTDLEQTAAVEAEDVSEGSLLEANPKRDGAIKGTAEKEVQCLREEVQRLQAELRESMQENCVLKSCLPPSSENTGVGVGSQGDTLESKEFLEEEVHELKMELARVRTEQERDRALEQEKLRRSYNQLMEASSQEKALLMESNREAQEEITILQEALKGTVSVEAAAKDFEEMKAELSQVIDGLQHRLVELSHSYSEAHGKLEAQQAEELRLQQLESQLEETRAAGAQVEVRYQKALEQLGLLKREVEVQARSTVPLADHTQVVSSLGSAIKGLEEQVAGLRDQLTRKTEQVGVLQEQLVAEKQATAGDSAGRQALEAEVARLTQLLHEALRKQDEMALEVAEAWQHLKEEQQARQSLASSGEQQKVQLCSQYAEAQEALAEQRKRMEALLSSEREKNRKIEELTREVSKLKEALNSLSQLSYASGAPKRQNQQVDSLQQQIRQLQLQLAECKKQHHEVISVYRMHLLYAVQGQMDEDVQKALKQILMMCKMPTETK